MKTLAIIAPHQDDEILSCTYVMKNAIKNGDRVLVLFITNGDYYGKEFARIRFEESLKALLEIGIARENIYFLGYGDGSIYNLYCKKDNSIIISKCLQSKTYTPNGFKTFHKIKYGEESLYTRDFLSSDLGDFFRLFLPHEVYCPSKYDVHVDHLGTYCFVKQVLEYLNIEEKYKPKMYTYLIHIKKHFAYWPNRLGRKVNKPMGIAMSNEFWRKRLIVKGENNSCKFKHKLISYFISQKPHAVYGFLYAFVKDEEIFWNCEI